MIDYLPSEPIPGTSKRSLDRFINIADVTISLASDHATLPLRIGGALEKFLVGAGDADIHLRVSFGDLSKAACGEKIFDSGGLWQLFSSNKSYRFRFRSDIYGALPYKEAIFNFDFTVGNIELHQPYFASSPEAYPLEYPLDELLLIHLLARGRGAEVHACGVVDDLGNGRLFIGQSGAGKTTMARLWEKKKNITILSDDRIVLRNMNNRIWMYGTPWHGEAMLSDPSCAPLTRICFLQHGQKNKLFPQTKTEAVERLFACSFPPFYSSEALDFTLAFFEEIVEAVPCYELSFVPDAGVVQFIEQVTA